MQKNKNECTHLFKMTEKWDRHNFLGYWAICIHCEKTRGQCGDNKGGETTTMEGTRRKETK